MYEWMLLVEPTQFFKTQNRQDGIDREKRNSPFLRKDKQRQKMKQKKTLGNNLRSYSIQTPLTNWTQPDTQEDSSGEKTPKNRLIETQNSSIAGTVNKNKIKATCVLSGL